MSTDLPSAPQGPYGRVERVGTIMAPIAPALVDAWILSCPAWHPLFNQWYIGVVTLADMEDMEPARRDPAIPGATHELLVATLDPTAGARIDGEFLRTRKQLPFLTPINISQQFLAMDDDHAREVLWLVVKAALDGRLNPEVHSDSVREAWATAIVATAAHRFDPYHGAMN